MHNGFNVEDSMINNKKYDGKTKKFGITVGSQDYIVKFMKDGAITSLYSEHLASRFIRNIGIPCHETWLGYYNKTPVVIMKDFTNKKVILRSYKSTGESSEDTSITDKKYTHDDVLHMINQHTKMSDFNKQRAKIQFWQMFICDAILGNRDRHPGNWGYLVHKGETSYTPAPLYDNGASLFPDLNKRIKEYAIALKTNKEYKFIENRAEKFPASLFMMERNNGEIKRTNYYEILSDLRINKLLAHEVREIREKVGFNQIYESIFREVSEVRHFMKYEYRRFYIVIVCVRYLHIIERKSIKDSYIKTLRRLDNETREY